MFSGLITTWRWFRFDTYFRRRFLRHSAAIGVRSTDNLLAVINTHAHMLEKGISMPRRRLQFGRDAVLRLCRFLHEYLVRCGRLDEVAVVSARTVLKDYLELHSQANVDLAPDVEAAVVRTIRELHDANIPDTTSRSYLAQGAPEDIAGNLGFSEFSRSRRSVRDYVPIKISPQRWQSIFELAATAPSSCNRQTSRAYVIESAKLKNEVLACQNGNRGFGEAASYVLLLAGDLTQYVGIAERNLVYVDVGIYAMNLLYSLHQHGIAACALNWAYTVPADRAARKLVGIPDSQEICLIITIGGFPDRYLVANSERVSWDKVVVFSDVPVPTGQDSQ